MANVDSLPSLVECLVDYISVYVILLNLGVSVNYTKHDFTFISAIASYPYLLP